MKNIYAKLLTKWRSIALTTTTMLLVAKQTFAAGVGNQIRGNFDDVASEGFGVTGEELDQSLPALIGGYINAALGLLGMILVVIIIYAGFLWMTAGGSEEKVTKAKKLIINAIIGMVIIMASYAITGFVLDAVLGAES